MEVMDSNGSNSSLSPSPSAASYAGPQKRRNWLRFLGGGNSRRSALVKNLFLYGNDKEICDFVRQDPDICRNTYSFFCSVDHRSSNHDNNMDDRQQQRESRSGGNVYVYPLLVVCRRCSASTTPESNNNKQLSIETIELIYQNSNPDAIMLTLHHACATKASLEVVEFLVSKHPDGPRFTKKGWLPLHIAIAYGAPYDVIDYLLECYPDSVQQRGGGAAAATAAGGGGAAGGGMAGGIGFVVGEITGRSYTSSSSITADKRHQYKLPIHLAIKHGASLDVLKLLVAKYPEGLQKADYETTEIITVENKKKKEGGQHHEFREEKNATNNNTNDNNDDGDGAAFFAENSINGGDNDALVNSINDCGWISHKGKFSMDFWSTGCGLPLHLACCRSGNSSISSSSSNNENEGNRDHNNNDRNDLSASTGSSSSSDNNALTLRYLKFLIKQYPPALKTKNRFGWLPIHCACYYGASIDTIRYLVEACPESLYQRCDVKFAMHNGHYPVEMCIQQYNNNNNKKKGLNNNNNNNSMDVIQYLLSQHSAADHNRVGDGAGPNQKLLYHYLDSAQSEFASSKVTNLLKNVYQQASKGYSYVNTTVAVMSHDDDYDDDDDDDDNESMNFSENKR